MKITADGRVAEYSGDDERFFECINQFASKGRCTKGTTALARGHDSALLDDARSTSRSSPAIFAGAGEWHRPSGAGGRAAPR